jgi:ABC-2 type transport system permease protein
MARSLEVVSAALPLTYAYEALHGVSVRPGIDGAVVADVAVTALMASAALVLGAATLRRQSP